MITVVYLRIKITEGYNRHSLLRHMRQHKSKKYKDKYTIKRTKTQNFKIDSKRKLQQHTQKRQKSLNSAQVIIVVARFKQLPSVVCTLQCRR